MFTTAFSGQGCPRASFSTQTQLTSNTQSHIWRHLAGDTFEYTKENQTRDLSLSQCLCHRSYGFSMSSQLQTPYLATATREEWRRCSVPQSLKVPLEQPQLSSGIGNIHLFTSALTLLKASLLHVPSPSSHQHMSSQMRWRGATHPHATYWLFLETAMHFPSKQPSSSNLCRHFLLLTSQMKTSPSSGCRIKEMIEVTFTGHKACLSC